MAAHTITITATLVPPSNTEVNFTYSPSTIRVSPGDTVQWTSPSGPFVVMFTERTPIANVSSAGPPGPVIDAHSSVSGPPWSTPPPPLAFTVPPGTIGHFHYAVALALLSSAGQASVHIDAGCPEILAG